jgi:IMP dehydrogenase
MKILNNKAISFDDIVLIPQHSDINSRSEINTTVKIAHENNTETSFKIPIISSPMSTVTEAHMCNAIRSQGGLGIIHRYNTIEYQTRLLSFVSDNETKAAAIGVSGDFKERLSSLVEKGLKIVCIDIAHGDHKLMENAIEFVRSEYNDLFVIAGNVATGSGYKRLAYAGAHGIRTSVGSGSICTTRIQTGHGMPTLSAIIEISKAKKELITELNYTSKSLPFVIADGGIKNSGDIVKSLAAGADFVMLGSMLSGTKETPGKIILNSEGNKIKRYNGMASKLAQKNWKGSYSSIEGVSSYVNYKGTVSKVINEIMSNVRSGMSYTGARSLKELREEAIAIIQTNSSHSEGNPHIFNRR